MAPILNSLAKFATTLSYSDLPPNAVHAAEDRMLNALGCALGAYDCDTAQVGRSLTGRPARRTSP